MSQNPLLVGGDFDPHGEQPDDELAALRITFDDNPDDGGPIIFDPGWGVIGEGWIGLRIAHDSQREAMCIDAKIYRKGPWYQIPEADAPKFDAERLHSGSVAPGLPQGPRVFEMTRDPVRYEAALAAAEERRAAARARAGEKLPPGSKLPGSASRPLKA